MQASDRQLSEILSQRQQPAPGTLTETQEKNRRLSTHALSYISELRGSQAWQWFERECLQSLAAEAEAALKSPDTKPEALGIAKERYLMARAFKVWLDEHDASHRACLNPNDPEIRRIKERINAA